MLSASKGLLMKSSMPAASARSRSAISAPAVRATIGSCAAPGNRRIWRVASMPSMTGICTSIRDHIDGGVVIGDQVHRLLAVGGNLHERALALQQPPTDVEIDAAVVDQQDARPDQPLERSRQPAIVDQVTDCRTVAGHDPVYGVEQRRGVDRHREHVVDQGTGRVLGRRRSLVFGHQHDGGPLAIGQCLMQLSQDLRTVESRDLPVEDDGVEGMLRLQSVGKALQCVEPAVDALGAPAERARESRQCSAVR